MLHGLYIAWNRYLFGTLRKLLPSETSKARKALDSVIAGFVLRDPKLASGSVTWTACSVRRASPQRSGSC